MPRLLSGSDKMTLKGIGDLVGPSAYCKSCGSGTCEKGYIDTGINMDFEGELYLCLTCSSELAETAGLLSKEESDYLIELNKDMADEVSALKLKMAGYNEQRESYERVISDLTSRSSPSSFGNSSVPLSNLIASKPKPSETDREIIDGFNNDGKTTESIVTEPVKSEGRSNITGDAIRDLNL